MTMQELWTEYGTEALIALGGGVLTALIMRIKAWQQGLVDEDAPLLRQAVAYVLAYAAALAAVRHVLGTWRYAAIAVAISLALAVTINGRHPLFTRSYLRSFAIALAAALAFWGLYVGMLFLGFDLIAPRRP
jgi:hypothetical protein